jgi:predicted RNase H-like HicB family nuclease
MRGRSKTHKMVYQFEIDIQCDANEGPERLYQAACRQLPGCIVHADSEGKALKKIQKAIHVWFEIAYRRMTGLERSTAEYIQRQVSE